MLSYINYTTEADEWGGLTKCKVIKYLKNTATRTIITVYTKAQISKETATYTTI